MSQRINELEKEIEQLKAENKRLSRVETDIYKMLFDASPDIIIQVDTDCRILKIHLPDYSEDQLVDLIGKDIFEVAPPEHHFKIERALNKVFTTGEPVHYETEGMVLGSYKYLMNYVSLLPASDGRAPSAYFLIREITMQKLSEKRNRENDRKLKVLFESSKHIHILLDLNGEITWFNQQANLSAITFYGKELKKGKNVTRYLSGYLLKQFDEYYDRAREGETVSFYQSHIIGPEEQCYLEVLLQPIKESGKLTRISLVGVDITELRKKENKLVKINEELILQNQQLNQFSYVISHNLRGPIVTLLGLINVIEEYNDDMHLKEEMFIHIKKTALNLDTVIKDLNLLLSQNGDHAQIKSLVSLEDEIKMVKNLLKTQIEESNAILVYDFDEVPVIYSVTNYIRSIFINLISNSIKYRKPDSAVFIGVRSQKGDNDKTELIFEDNGLGIDLEANAHKIFGMYKRFHNHVEGKGLGLHLVKNQVSMMNGTIEVQSKVNEGTCFRIIL